MHAVRWNSLLNNLCLSLNTLALFLALFGEKMQVPVLLQVFGRAHPMLLHFPIVLLVLALVWELSTLQSPHPSLRKAGDALLLAAAVSAALTALMGIFLSKEGGYAADTLRWHQWSGLASAYLAWGWYAFRASFRQTRRKAWLAGCLVIVVLLLAGHHGATLTHGEHYLLAPVMPEKQEPTPPFEEALVFAQVIRPILKEKCMGCHNAEKSKGDLIMETEAQLLKGGKNGVLWDSTAAQFGLFLQRVHLPEDEKEHMPPKGKPQLGADEMEAISQWIKSGASFTQKVSDLPESSPLWTLASDRLKSNQSLPYPFDAAPEGLVKKLNNGYRVVTPLGANSPALSVAFYGISNYKSLYLKELEIVREQIVHLSLNKMPVQDEDLKVVGQFTNLRQLNLAFTQISGATLSELAGLKALTSLSLSGTSVKTEHLSALSALPQLTQLYLWNTAVQEADLALLRQQLPRTQIQTGYDGAGVVAKLNAPVIEGEEQVFSQSTKIKLKNFIPGASIRYTLDGTTPDSLQALLATGDSITIDHSCQVVARAFLPGWVSSETATRNFYKTGILPDSILLRYPPNPQYKGEGAKTLANKKIGDTDFRSNKWLGYKETNLEALLFFKEPKTLSSVSLSTLVDIGSYIMPAAEIQVWGGNGPNSLQLLKKITPKQPDKVGQPGYRIGYSCRFAQQKVRVLKIVAKPIGKLPPWHPGKGDKAWVFVDELFLE